MMPWSAEELDGLRLNAHIVVAMRPLDAADGAEDRSGGSPGLD